MKTNLVSKPQHRRGNSKPETQTTRMLSDALKRVTKISGENVPF